MKFTGLIAVACVGLCAPAHGQSAADDMKAGFKLLKNDRPSDAAQCFTHVLDHNPASLNAHFGRGVARAECHEPDGAIEDLTLVAKARPRDPKTHYWRALAYEQRRRYAEAKDDYTVALATDEPLTKGLRYDCLVYRGLNYHELGQLAAARADMDAAIKLDPTLPEGWAGRARIRRAQGDETGAQSDSTHAAAIDPEIGNDLVALQGVRFSRVILWGVIAVVAIISAFGIVPLIRSIALLVKEEKK